ncbi:putative ribonuclease H-like domain-containing protein, partial [Tanacetum coccineum]
ANSNDSVDGSLFDSSLKNASNDEPQPSSDAGKKDDECVNKESRIDDQEGTAKNAQDVNTFGPSINTTSINTGILNINTASLTVTPTSLEAINADFFDDETEVDMSNITRIHKDHSLDHVIGDVQSGVQTRRMTKTTNEQGFISAVYEGKTHEEPKKVIPSIKRSKLDRSYARRASAIQITTSLDNGGFTIWQEGHWNKMEEGIDYNEVFALVARIEAIRLFLAYASFKDFVVYQMDVKSAFLYGKIEEEVYVCQPPSKYTHGDLKAIAQGCKS